MQNRKIRILPISFVMALVFCLFMAVSAMAQDAVCPNAKGPKPVGPVNSSNGGVYKKGQYGIVGKYTYMIADQYYYGTSKTGYERLKPGQKGKKCTEKTLNKYQLTLRAGIFEDFDFRLVVPFLDKELKRESAKASFTDSNSGLGDIKLVSRYRVMSQKKKDPLNLAIGLGVEMPTGTTDEEDDAGACPGYLQTGWGSWNPIFELGVHKVMGRHWMSTYFMYKMSTEGERGEDDFEGSDVFKYNAAYMFALCNWFDMGVELNGEVKSKCKLAGETQQHTGGHTVFITPEVHFKLYKGIHLDVGVPITVYRDLNGEQLSEDYRVVTKLAMKF
ncbi:transporter [Desulfoplanes sp.]